MLRNESVTSPYQSLPINPSKLVSVSDLRSSAMLQSVDWQLVADVSGQPIEDGTDRVSRNVGDY